MVLSRSERRGEADQGSRRVLEGRAGLAVAIAPRDRIYLARALELARRGVGSVSPNPPVGAVIVRDGRTLGEGFHRMRGEPHAEIEALRVAAARGESTRGATLYCSLEPCDHTGLTPPCTTALLEAGVARVVVAALDPNPITAGGGLARLRAAGVEVDLAESPAARALLEAFAVVVRGMRPFVHLKLAVSLDGYVAPAPGMPYALTGEPARAYVRELRARYDALLVGASTVRVDDPQLTVRPPRARRRPYVRVVLCETSAIVTWRRIFVPLDAEHERAAYARTIVMAPRGAKDAFDALAERANLVLIGEEGATELDLDEALRTLARMGIGSILCEGGPTLGAALVAAGLVDRLDWIVAPQLLASPTAVPAFAPAEGAGRRRLAIDRTARLGDDVLISATFEETACSAD